MRMSAQRCVHVLIVAVLLHNVDGAAADGIDHRHVAVRVPREHNQITYADIKKLLLGDYAALGCECVHVR